VLTGSVHWEQAVQSTKVSNLSVLPRGTITHRSSEFFLSPSTRKMLDEIKAKYEVVVIDTAPVMAADDVTSLAPLVDAVVFVLRADFTSARVAHAALDSLYQRKARVMGIVFNSVRPNSSDYYYYYKYKDYYSTTPVTEDTEEKAEKEKAKQEA
jgi:Mrp family chromosome partitioning ATPase